MKVFSNLVVLSSFGFFFSDKHILFWNGGSCYKYLYPEGKEIRLTWSSSGKKWPIEIQAMPQVKKVTTFQNACLTKQYYPNVNIDILIGKNRIS